MKHAYKTPEECDCDKFDTNCPICDGGLVFCKVCGGFEGGLTTDCPGQNIPMDTNDAVYAGKLDYREGKGWVPEKNPTNQTWEYGAAYNHARNMQGEYSVGCFGNYTGAPICATCGLRTDCENTTVVIKSYEARKGVPE